MKHGKYKDYLSEEIKGKLDGKPDDNIYVLMAPYCHLGDTHACEEPCFYGEYIEDPETGEKIKNPYTSPMGLEWYLTHGSTWGKGGRSTIYVMYELGGLFSGKYREKCGHASADTPTTNTERGDSMIYETNNKIKLAREIFGVNCLADGTGRTDRADIYLDYKGDNIVEMAIACHAYLRKLGLVYGQEVDDHGKMSENFANATTCDCSSFVCWVLYRLGYEGFDGLQSSSEVFQKNPWGFGVVYDKDENIGSIDDALPGDILVYFTGFDDLHHVEILAYDGGNRFWVYNCGNDTSIGSAGTAEYPEATESYKTKSQITKILRPGEPENKPVSDRNYCRQY